MHKKTKLAILLLASLTPVTLVLLYALDQRLQRSVADTRIAVRRIERDHAEEIRLLEDIGRHFDDIEANHPRIAELREQWSRIVGDGVLSAHVTKRLERKEHSDGRMVVMKYREGSLRIHTLSHRSILEVPAAYEATLTIRSAEPQRTAVIIYRRPIPHPDYPYLELELVLRESTVVGPDD